MELLLLVPVAAFVALLVQLASAEAVAAHPDNGWKATAVFTGWCVAALIPAVGLGVFITLLVRAWKRHKLQRTEARSYCAR